jgi:hypothetical protein
MLISLPPNSHCFAVPALRAVWRNNYSKAMTRHADAVSRLILLSGSLNVIRR